MLGKVFTMATNWILQVFQVYLILWINNHNEKKVCTTKKTFLELTQFYYLVRILLLRSFNQRAEVCNSKAVQIILMEITCVDLNIQ